MLASDKRGSPLKNSLISQERSRRTTLGVRDSGADRRRAEDRKSTRLNSSHLGISYAVFCLKKKKKKKKKNYTYIQNLNRQIKKAKTKRVVNNVYIISTTVQMGVVDRSYVLIV